MIHKILIANRGEIAMRIIRTARNLGYRTVAVYSTADTQALHVQTADEAVCIGGAQATESYLAIDSIIAAAKRTGADAVHPGYGFLAENADFVRACKDAGVVFIGPGPEAMELMGSKRRSKVAMLEAGVPCIPGYQGESQSDEVLLAAAEKIGMPLMVKASGGGGGRGMRLVTDAAKLSENLKNARAEALSAFGNDELILEKAIIEPRHIEIQVFADAHGNAVYLGERDCSIQRRHQKVVEEAPSPFVDEVLRRKMGEAAVNAARACGYLGAGTVEFIVDEDKNFYFLEMNTRLQVEHPVTEMITGLDLVAWQIEIAGGGRLPLSQEEIEYNGHAIEVRLYAEDARRSFLPQTGKIRAWILPERDGVRVDCGIAAGQVVSSHYDPILAKVVAWGKNRDEARRRLASALQDTVLLGLDNNKFFLERIVRHPIFAAGEATTAFIDRHFKDDVSMTEDSVSAKTLALAAMLTYRSESPPIDDNGWHNPAPYRYHFRLACNEKAYDAALVKRGAAFAVTLMDCETTLEWVSVAGDSLTYIDKGVLRRARFAVSGNRLFLDDGNGHFIIENRTFEIAAAADTGGSGDVKSAINGMVVEVLVKEGDIVKIDQPLVIIEAMKMQQQLSATVNGTVASVLVAAQDQVKPKQLLVKLREGA